MRPHDEDAFRDFATTELPRARRAAYLMCADWTEAEDLAQQALVRLYGVWHKVERDGSLRAYVRTTVTRLWLDEVRRRKRRPELLVAQLPDRPADTGHPGASAGDRAELLDALAALAPRQRACLVLRYWEDLSVRDTAHALGCSEGTVKSLAHHGVRAMRDRLGTHPDLQEDHR